MEPDEDIRFDPVLGRLQRDRFGSWESELVVVAGLMASPVRFSLPDDDDLGPVRETAHAAVAAFVQLAPDALNTPGICQALADNYGENQEFFCPDGLEHDEAADLWRYVQPHDAELRLPRAEPAVPYIVVECECAWEPEHGLQLVFREGTELVRVSQYDSHLTGTGMVSTDGA